MKKISLILAAGVLLAGTAGIALAADIVTITGNMVCAKCVLHETTTCQNVVQVTQGTNTVNYYLKQNDVSKAAHTPICGGSNETVTVTGTVKEKHGKEVMTPTKIDVVKS
jgi:azurin